MVTTASVVPAMKTAVVATAVPAFGRSDASRRARTRSKATPAITAIAISGRYIRRSAPTSVAIGMTLDAGASVRKNHAPRNPILGERTSATTVAARSATTTATYG